MIVARRPRLLLSRSAAATVSCVDCPLTCNTRANVSTRSDRSCKVITAHPNAALESGGRLLIQKRATGGKKRRLRPHTFLIFEAQKCGPSGRRCHIRVYHLAWVDNGIKIILPSEST